MHTFPIPIPERRIEELCRRWGIDELSIFGSAVRSDFRPDSDIDVLIALRPGHGLSMFDLVDIEDELREMFGHDVDLVLKGGLRNPFRRREILDTRKVIYAA